MDSQIFKIINKFFLSLFTHEGLWGKYSWNAVFGNADSSEIILRLLSNYSWLESAYSCTVIVYWTWWSKLRLSGLRTRYFSMRKNTPAEKELVGVCVFTSCADSSPTWNWRGWKAFRCYPSSVLWTSLSKLFRTFSQFLSWMDVGPGIILAELSKK